MTRLQAERISCFCRDCCFNWLGCKQWQLSARITSITVFVCQETWENMKWEYICEILDKDRSQQRNRLHDRTYADRMSHMCVALRHAQCSQRSASCCMCHVYGSLSGVSPIHHCRFSSVVPSVCVCACVRVCVRACVRVCVCPYPFLLKPFG